MPDQRRREYLARINPAMDFIETHLAEEITLEEIARVAHFSPFHFHRVFSALMGEPVSQFVQRIRLEKAAFLLRAHAGRPVSRIAMECGYGSHAAFSRAFRSAFGQSPTAWRTKGGIHPGELSKDGKGIRKDGKDRSRMENLCFRGHAAAQAARTPRRPEHVPGFEDGGTGRGSSRNHCSLHPPHGSLCRGRGAPERCLNNPEDHPEQKHLVEICVPVKPLP